MFSGGSSSSSSGCRSSDARRVGREPGRGGALLEVQKASTATRVSGSSGEIFWNAFNFLFIFFKVQNC